MSEELRVEATGETAGEAKWAALRELERLQPNLDRAAVRFQVVSEGQRGLLGVGYEPARVAAAVDADAVAPVATAVAGDSVLAAHVRDALERITAALGIRCRIAISETDETITASCSGGEIGLLIGKHGQTIDAIQYLLNAVVFRAYPDERKAVVVDASGYRQRREAALTALAQRSAEQAVSDGSPVPLEPMTAVERKVVHEALKDYPGIETTSEGTEPNRFVVVLPAAEPPARASGRVEEVPGEPGRSAGG